MQKSALGDSGLEVSSLGLGTWAMGGDEHVWGRVDDRESIATIHEALDLGINLIDTAPDYGHGHSEETVGRAIHGRREEVLLSTKCGLMSSSRPDQPADRNLSRERIHRECEGSLRRLRVDVIDIYQCHAPDPNTPIRETMDALTSLLDQGKIRAIGLANYGCERITEAREYGPIHCLQTPFSILHRRASDTLLPFCREHRIGVLPCGPLAKGLLTGKFTTDTRFIDLRAHDPEFRGDRFRRNLRLTDQLRQIAGTYNKTVAQLAINWAAGVPGVSATLVGAKRPSQILENAGGVGWTLSPEDRAQVDAFVSS